MELIIENIMRQEEPDDIGMGEAPRLDEEVVALIRRVLETRGAKIHVGSHQDFTLLCQALKWCAGVVAALLIVSVPALIVMYGNQRSIETALTETQQSVTVLTAEVKDLRAMIERRLPQ